MHWQTFYWIAGGILALAWFSRIVEAAFGMPHVANIARPEWDRRPAAPSGEPRVSIIVPARNEEESIRQTLVQLLALDYSNYEIIAVNDRSTDRTGQIMEEVAASSPSLGLLKLGLLKVIHISELLPGWLGKTHAMWMAGQQARGDWLLFTDADVLFKPDSLRRAVAYAQAERADHVVLFPRMIMKGPEHIGVTGDFSGGYKSETVNEDGVTGSASAHLYTYTGGPVVAFHEGPINPFVHALFGGFTIGGNASGCVTGGNCASGSASTNGFAMMFGGGVDAKLNKAIAIRVAQFDWIYYHANGGSLNQNYRFSSGIVLRF